MCRTTQCTVTRARGGEQDQGASESLVLPKGSLLEGLFTKEDLPSVQLYSLYLQVQFSSFPGSVEK
eukprot:2251564-Rhodomonas_salina.1